MKIVKHILLIALIAIFSSCSDWFEVEADNEITKEDLFSTYDGYRTALNGIYRKLSGTALYGQEMSWCFLSFLGNNYDASMLWSPNYAVQAVKYDYEHADVKNVTEAIWETGYNVIINCNVLIQNAETKDAEFFYEGEREKRLILGEAKGLRAFMHFDLLRLFAPAPVVGDGKAYIPYVTKYPTFNPEHLPVNVVIDSIIADLSYAREALAEDDTLTNASMLSSVVNRFHNNVVDGAKGGLFFAYRGSRMNYFAATALLARVYLYKGDKTNALKYASEVYRYGSAGKNWFPFTASGNLNNSNRHYRHCKLYDDILLAFTNSKLTDLYQNWYTNNYVWNRLSIKNTTHLFAGDYDDFRYSMMIFEGYSLKWEPITVDPVYSWFNSDIDNFQLPQEPIIRMSEMYYVMCECLADTDLSRAIDILNQLRTARGCKTELSKGLTKDEFLTALWNDMTREFIAEGQTFFLYKRLNKSMYNGDTPINMSGKYVIPMPDSEMVY